VIRKNGSKGTGRTNDGELPGRVLPIRGSLAAGRPVRPARAGPPTAGVRLESLTYFPDRPSGLLVIRGTEAAEFRLIIDRGEEKDQPRSGWVGAISTEAYNNP
jgi:hypothetical protein